MTRTSARTALEQILIDEIAKTGPVSFARFVELVLYHPAHGYYMTGRMAAKAKGGDFYTSPQVSSLFGEILAQCFLSLWKTMGCEKFRLVEMGAGEGRLAHDVLRALESHGATKGLSYILIEKNPAHLSAALRRLSRFSRVNGSTDLDGLEESSLDGCVFSNEFFDALPFHRLVKEGDVWREVGIAWRGERFLEVLIPLTISLPGNFPAHPRENGELSALVCRPQAGDWLQKCSGLISRGYILTVDYGSGRPDYWDPLRAGDQWGCFRRHSFDKDPCSHLGEKDITADVDFTSLAEAGLACGLPPLYFNTQANFLLSAGKEIWQNQLQKESRETRLAAQQLLHPSGMGEAFQVLLQAKSAPLPPFLMEQPNRLKRLGLVKLTCE